MPRPSHVFRASIALVCFTACTERAPVAATEPEAPRLSGNPTSELASTFGVRKAVTLDGINAHLAAFSAIAANNGGDRFPFNPGGAASRAYARGVLEAAGYTVTTQDFAAAYTGEATPSTFARVSPVPRTYSAAEFRTMSYSGSATVTGSVVAVDVYPLSGNFATSGCEAADFAGFPAGSIALVKRGICTFALKADNARAAGAVGVIIFNHDLGDPDGQLNGTLNAPIRDIPVIGTTHEVGTELMSLLSGGPVTVSMTTSFVVITGTGTNLIAELPLGDANDVVLVGAPIDSRTGDPGVNGASGGATLLEIARVFAAQERNTRNRTRFVLFDAHMMGNLGSAAYANALSPTEVAKLRAVVNLDRLGSPNFARFVLSGVTAGSTAIASMFTSYFDGVGLPFDDTAMFPGPWDGLSFVTRGVPTVTLTGGATALKTPAQQAAYGGVAGVAYDPCWGLPCDGLANVNAAALDGFSDAAAHGVLLLSKRNFTKNPLIVP